MKFITNIWKTPVLGVLMLSALLVMSTMPMTGCTQQQVANVAQNIVNWTPALQAAITTVDSSAVIFDSNPADAAVFADITAAVDAGSPLVVAQAKAYLANPSAAVLAQLQSQITTFQQQVNTSLLQAAKISNPSSQQHVLAEIGAVAVIVNAMVALVESVSTKAAVAQMASQSTVKLAQVDRYLDNKQAAKIVADHYQEPVIMADVQVAMVHADLERAGF